MDAGGHGIFDFIHRDPKTMLPYLSTSRTEESGRTLKLGEKWQVPLSGGTVELLRRGKAFWEVLEEKGVPTTIIRMPANFPPSGTAMKELSGMGTPDVGGSYGTFSYFTSDPWSYAKTDFGGGKLYGVEVIDNKVEGTLFGPPNPFLIRNDKVSLTYTAYLDPVEPVAKIVVGDEERILREGEWSDWVPVEFEFIPTQGLPAICRFYLKQVRPEFELYVTPLDYDPLQPAMPISTPASYATELAEATGLYYTEGMPEDTAVFNAGLFDHDEFLAQARLPAEENFRQYQYVLDRFEDGLLFYYFGNVDQISHMLWRPMDPNHPAYDPEVDAPYEDVIKQLYVGLDSVVGYTLDRIDDPTLLVVMSDHGFTSWRRSFHLNAWLAEEGYLALIDPDRRGDGSSWFANAAWSRTKAYGAGINALYLNLAGRERWGIVSEAEREDLMEEIAEKLLAIVDPATGKPAITKVYRREEVYKDRGHLEIGPDLVVGFAKGTRGSEESALGAVGLDVITDKTEPWSGDHCMDHETVPGILLTTRPLKKQAAELKDLAAAILAEFGVEEFPPRQ
jgi:predicted AlkP superfamily phosphohydrolase/phosphomutase